MKVPHNDIAMGIQERKNTQTCKYRQQTATGIPDQSIKTDYEQKIYPYVGNMSRGEMLPEHAMKGIYYDKSQRIEPDLSPRIKIDDMKPRTGNRIEMMKKIQYRHMVATGRVFEGNSINRKKDRAQPYPEYGQQKIFPIPRHQSRHMF